MKIVYIILGSILVAAMTTSALADFSYPDFTSSNGLNLVGNASVYSDRLRVTSASSYQTGAAWYTAKQSIESGFSTTFQFQITNVYGGDGFAFVIQNHSLTAMGGLGGLLGYGGDPELYPHLGEGIPSSLAVEFDMPINPEFGDPVNNHISVQTRGDLPNSPRHIYSLGETSNISTMADGALHLVRLEYNPGLLNIYFDGSNVLNISMDISSTLSLDEGSAWVGFTGATGSAYENHDIVNWSYTETPEPATLLLLGLGGLLLRKRSKA